VMSFGSILLGVCAYQLLNKKVVGCELWKTSLYDT